MVGWLVGNAKILMTRNRLKNGFLTITAPAWRRYSPRPLTYCPCPTALLPLPTSSDYGLAVFPALFSIYFDDLTKLLRKEGNGCHIGFTFLASIFYADDICLLAPTRSALQRMINTCANYCKTFGLSFNPKKSKVMMFSKANIKKRIN